MLAKDLACLDFIVLIINMCGCVFVRSGMYVGNSHLLKYDEVPTIYKTSGGKKRTFWSGDSYEQLHE